jgi:hypothetical protein
MSRYIVTLHKGERMDDEAVFGFDPPLRTYFLQGFEGDDDFGTPEIWLARFWKSFRHWRALSKKPAPMATKSAISIMPT